ncbi:MAG: FHA domain-containing protein [Solirubrobacterales bacterium]
MEGHGEVSAAELQARRRGDPYLVYRDGHGREQVLSLPDTWDRITFGRGMAATVILAWDEDVSRTHAELHRIGDDWALVDDGLSRNGSFVNGERVSGRRRLRDGDELRLGDTRITFRAPFEASDRTRTAHEVPPELPG